MSVRFHVACFCPGQHQSVAQLIKLVSNKLRTSGTVSVTLKGRWYQPKGDQDIAPASVCQTSTAAIKSNYRYDSGPQAGISFDKQLRRTLTLETENSLREKLCDLKRDIVGIEFSIAVYDVDFDAAGPACSSLNHPWALPPLADDPQATKFLQGPLQAPITTRTVLSDIGLNVTSTNASSELRSFTPKD
ncbi:hypothetical protein MTO96_033929, partial [Rhipicephalus appendiculatus]